MCFDGKMRAKTTFKSQPVARVERSDTRGKLSPHFASLNAGY
jgi:hypothetical protein